MLRGLKIFKLSRHCTCNPGYGGHCGTNMLVNKDASKSLLLLLASHCKWPCGNGCGALD